MKNLKAIILAAGSGERLKPLTDKIPKGMVKLFGKSLLEWQINVFRNCEIYDISIVTGYKGDMINFSNIHYFRNKNYDSTNMVETLFCAKEKISESVIVSYGDIIFQKDVLEKLILADDDISVIIDENWEEYWKIRFENPLEDAESLVIDEEKYIQNIGQKVNTIQEINGQYIGLMKFQKDGTEFLKRFYEKSKNESKSGVNPLNPKIVFEKSFMTDLLHGMIKSGYKIKSVPVKNGWLELDTLHDYELYEKMYSEGTMNRFIQMGSEN